MTEILQEVYCDRSSWAEGPWDNEPLDRVEWRHESGLPLLITRNGAGGWCGYVGVPPGHDLYEVDYSEVRGLEVHGGLTYSAKCAGHICHVAQPGEPDEVWWLGFDHGHMSDLLPGSPYPSYGSGGTYRDQEYARAGVESLSEQIVAKSYHIQEVEDEDFFD